MAYTQNIDELIDKLVEIRSNYGGGIKVMVKVNEWDDNNNFVKEHTAELREVEVPGALSSTVQPTNILYITG